MSFVDDADEPDIRVACKPRVILFFAEWCGHCKSFKGDPAVGNTETSTWGRLKNDTQLEDRVTFTEEDSTDNPSPEEEKYGVKGYPTLIMEPPAGHKKYNGPRSFNDIANYIWTTM